MITDADNAEARSNLFEYIQLKAKIEHLESEQGILKVRLAAVMSRMGVSMLDTPDGKATTVTTHKCAYDIPKIIAAVPLVIPKLTISNDVYNKILIDNEKALTGCRTVLKTSTELRINAPKKA